MKLTKIDFYYYLIISLIFLVAYLLYGLSHDIKTKGAECMQDPINYGIRVLEDRNDAEVTCNLNRPHSNSLIFNGETIRNFRPDTENAIGNITFKDIQSIEVN